MQRIAVLDSSVRLIVFEFLMSTPLVPSIIQLKRPSAEPPLQPVSGVRVMESTPKVNLFGLASKLDCGRKYELVDVWKKAQHEEDWKMCFARFVFCRREHLNIEGLNPEFVAKRDGLENAFANMICKNLWATQAHLNPYFENDSPVMNPSGQHVLMFGCAGKTRDMVETTSPRLDLIGGNEITLEVPVTPVPEAVPAPAI